MALHKNVTPRGEISKILSQELHVNLGFEDDIYAHICICLGSCLCGNYVSPERCEEPMTL